MWKYVSLWGEVYILRRSVVRSRDCCMLNLLRNPRLLSEAAIPSFISTGFLRGFQLMLIPMQLQSSLVCWCFLYFYLLSSETCFPSPSVLPRRMQPSASQGDWDDSGLAGLCLFLISVKLFAPDCITPSGQPPLIAGWLLYCYVLGTSYYPTVYSN